MEMFVIFLESSPSSSEVFHEVPQTIEVKNIASAVYSLILEKMSRTFLLGGETKSHHHEQ